MTTLTILRALGAGANAGPLAEAMDRHFPAYGITTRLRKVHFLAQAAHESGGFVYLRELWGPTPAQVRYEGRLDLGNNQPGDGRRFRGRGIFQLTGRDNYRRYGRFLALPLEAQPELAETPEVAVRTALEFWKQNKLAAWADLDNTLAVSNGINRGNPRSTLKPNGWDDRLKRTNALKALIV